MSYTYIRSEPGLWTVGTYAPDGAWLPESDHDSREDAAAQVAYLNGGPRPGLPGASLMVTPRDRRLLLAALADAATYRSERATEYCDVCESAAAGACDEHADDVDQAEQFRALARRIGGES